MKRAKYALLIVGFLGICFLAAFPFVQPIIRSNFEHRVAESLRQNGAAVTLKTIQPEAQSHRFMHDLKWPYFDRITAIDFHAVDLQASWLTSLEKLEALKSLDCSGCNLTGEQLERLGSIKTLCSLSLNDNPLLGDDDFQGLSRHPNLSELQIDGTGISLVALHQFAMKAPALQGLKNHYSWERTAAPGKFSAARAVTSRLTKYDRNSMASASVAGISIALFKHSTEEQQEILDILVDSDVVTCITVDDYNLTKEIVDRLKRIDLGELNVYGSDDCEIDWVTNIASVLPGLRKLRYRGNKDPGQLSALSQLKGLTELAILGMFEIERTDIEAFGRLERLNVLCLQSSPIPSDAIRSLLPNVKYVAVRNEIKGDYKNEKNRKLNQLWGSANGRFSR